jgi:hypothetical protein
MVMFLELKFDGEIIDDMVFSSIPVPSLVGLLLVKFYFLVFSIVFLILNHYYVLRMIQHLVFLYINFFLLKS